MASGAGVLTPTLRSRREYRVLGAAPTHSIFTTPPRHSPSLSTDPCSPRGSQAPRSVPVRAQDPPIPGGVLMGDTDPRCVNQPSPWRRSPTLCPDGPTHPRARLSPGPHESPQVGPGAWLPQTWVWAGPGGRRSNTPDPGLAPAESGFPAPCPPPGPASHPQQPQDPSKPPIPRARSPASFSPVPAAQAGAACCQPLPEPTGDGPGFTA